MYRFSFALGCKAEVGEEAVARLFLRGEASRLRESQCETGDCPAYDEAYPWDDLIPLARERATPYIGDHVQAAPWLIPDRPMP